MYDDILVPVDGSAGARRGAEFALDVAEKYGATVHALFVVDECFEGQTAALSTGELHFEAVEKEGVAAMAELERLAAERGLAVEKTCVRGEPGEEIVRYVEEEDIDLVVIGVHGTREPPRPHQGSVSDRVARATSVPVRVV